MSPYPSPLNPSETVERIREIIVGRHLERLEQRIAKLEATPPAPTTDTLPLDFFTENVQRLMDSNREETEAWLARCREETQRLAAQIQQMAAKTAVEGTPAAVSQLERKLGSWLTDWQSSFHVHLHDRDQRLANQLRNEVATLWENTESQLTRLESRAVDRETLEERFSRIAEAARTLAECASPHLFNNGNVA